MEKARSPILILGATGRQGGSVVRALSHARWPLRALVRDDATDKARTLADAGVELIQGSYADGEAIRGAMRGVHGVFSVMPAHLPMADEVRLGQAIADAAVDAGVAHFVYSSGASAGDKPTGVPRFDAKPRIEAYLRGLPLAVTIVRPMIFMDMLLNPDFGLAEGRYAFFLRPEQSMQLIAVEDIGKFVAAMFADKARFAGKTWKIASDTVTGNDLQAAFTQWTGQPIAYSRFPDDVLASSNDLRELAASLENGPLSKHVDLNDMREINPDLVSFGDWLAGHGAFEPDVRASNA